MLERLQSGNSVNWAPSIADAERITAKDVSIAAAKGDPLALDIFAEAGEHFGRVLAIVADLLAPELIVAGGVYMRAHDFMDDAMWRTLRREALPRAVDTLRVLPSALGEQIGDYAALTVAIRGLQR